MRILVVSDTHRQNDTYLEVLQKESQIDMVIHCGDAEGSEYLICESAGCPTEIVLGNNDFFSGLPREKELEIEGYKIWVTHGHNFYVSMDNEILKKEARARGMDMVLYGHTHKPVVEIEKGLVTLNPGSLTYPRQNGRRPSYAMMELQRGKEPKIQICYL